MSMTKGQVKWFDPKKGYGFIYGPEGQDVFVHYSHIQSDGFRTLKDGEWVEYEILQGDKGWQARAVKAIAPEGGSAPGAPTGGGPPTSQGHSQSHAAYGDVRPPQSTPSRPAPPAMSSGYEGGSYEAAPSDED
jgi:CspA family cold shock protein